jgi:KDO2-lipid IV(A) lauroyltransferase
MICAIIVRKFWEILTEGFMRALASLPLGFHYACARCISWFMKDILHYRRSEVMINLSRSFPDKKYKELIQIADKFYCHFGNIIAEMVWFGGCRNPERLRKKNIMTLTNPEVLENAAKNQHGVVIMDSHCGNWELIGGIFEYEPRLRESIEMDDLIVVYKPLKNKVWNEVVRKNRCAPVLRDGYKGYLSSREVLRYIIDHKNERKVYIVLNDQYPYKIAKDRDMITFMHQKTNAMEAVASMAHKFGMDVLYMNIKPVSRGHYEMRFRQICADASTMEPRQINQEFFSMLEQDLNELPWNYLWSHKRWK